MSEINVTPFVDVMLVLLVVFMVTAPLGVIHHQLNLTGQNVLTFASWALTLVLLGMTIRLGRRERTPFYVLIVVASMVGAFADDAESAVMRSDAPYEQRTAA